MGLWFMLTLSAQAQPSNPNTDWFSRAKYGAFIHFLPSGKAGLNQVEEFDVKALASQLEEMGAGYLVLTLGQNSGYFNSPNAAYEKRTGYAPGKRCATRDLPLEIYQALQPSGIRLMLYLPCQTPNQDARAQKAFGLAQGAQDQPVDLAFAEKWSEVIQEWSDRYGEKVSGWWFDGGYAHIHFNEAVAERYAAAVKHGNPKAIVTFNPGVKVIRWTKAEDYTAGELNEPLQVIPAGRRLEGSQWHALTYLGSSWGQRNTRFTDEQWVGWARKVTAQQGVLTLDMGPNYDSAKGPVGSLAEAQVKQIKAIRAALRPTAAQAPLLEGQRQPGEAGAGDALTRRDSFLGLKAGDQHEVGGIKLCWCAAGRFKMGSPPREPERRPGEDQVEVTLTKGFWMGKYEVTQGQWKRVIGELPGSLTAEGGEGEDLPVYNVNYSEAEEFCRKLSERALASGELPQGWGFRLPTEAQWEYSCRAGTTTATSFGDKISSKQANFQGKPYNGAEEGPSPKRATKVGSYPANAWGIHDMHGNVVEWCRDWYHAALPGGTDPDLSSVKGSMNRDGTFSRSRRGSAWTDDGWASRSAFRQRFEPERRADHIGFRVVLVPP